MVFSLRVILSLPLIFPDCSTFAASSMAGAPRGTTTWPLMMIGSSRLARNISPAAVLSTSIPSMSRTETVIPAGRVACMGGGGAGAVVGGGGGGGGGAEKNTASTSAVAKEKPLPLESVSRTSFEFALTTVPVIESPLRKRTISAWSTPLASRTAGKINLRAFITPSLFRCFAGLDNGQRGCHLQIHEHQNLIFYLEEAGGGDGRKGFLEALIVFLLQVCPLVFPLQSSCCQVVCLRISHLQVVVGVIHDAGNFFVVQLGQFRFVIAINGPEDRGVFVVKLHHHSDDLRRVGSHIRA